MRAKAVFSTLSQYLVSRQSAQPAICDKFNVLCAMTSDIEREAENAGDKMKAGAKSAENKAKETGKDVERETKERMD